MGLPLDTVDATEAQGELIATLPQNLTAQTDVGAELFLNTTAGNATAIYVVPLAGGVPQEIGVVGNTTLDAVTLDANYVYVAAGAALLRFER